MNANRRISGLIAMAFILGSAGCDSGMGRGTHGFDFGVEEDVPADVDTTTVQVPVITFAKPASNQIVTGSMPIEASVKDPLGKKVTSLRFGFKKGKDLVEVGQVTDVPDSGAVTLNADTTAAKDGSQVFWCVAETSDKRQGQATVQVLVDNTPPSVGPTQGSTPPDSNFMGSLDIVPCFNDGEGAGVISALISVRDNAVKSYEKLKNGCQPKITVQTIGWKSGPVPVVIEATDAAGHVNSVSYSLAFVPAPRFSGATSSIMSDGFSAARITGMKVNGKWVVAAAGSTGILFWERNALGDFEKSGDAITENSASLLVVGDMTGDGRDDLVVVESSQGEGPAIVIYSQNASGAFSKVTTAAIGSTANAIAVGDLNGDQVLDVAVALDKDSYSLGIMMSKVSGGVTSWGGIESFGGVPRPNQVAIGNFTADTKRDIILTRPGIGTLTLFKIDPGTATPTAGLNFDLYTGGKDETKFSGFVSLAVAEGLDKTYPDASIAVLVDASTGKMALVKGEMDPSKPPALSLLGTTLATGAKPGRILVSYIDGDKKPDVMVLCEGANMAMAYWGEQAKLIQGTSMAAGGNPRDMALSDVDGDGYLDIVVLDQTGTRLTAILFDKTGYLKSKVRRFLGVAMVLLPWPPIAMATGAFAPPLGGKKGLADIAVLGPDPEGGKFLVKFLVSDGSLPVDATDSADITCQADNTLALNTPIGLLAADVDTNGADDLIITTGMNSPGPDIQNGGTVLVMTLNPKTASHKTVSTMQKFWVAAGDAPTVATTGFLDGDPKPDLAVIAKFATVLRLQPFLNKNGNFIEITSMNLPLFAAKNPRAMTATKLFEGASPKEDYTDIVIANESSGDLTVYFGMSGGTLAASKTKHFAVGQLPKAVAVARLEGPVKLAGHETDDPMPDVVTLLASDVAISYAVKAENQWTLEPPSLLGHQGHLPVALALHDINVDGYIDIVVLNQQDSTVSVYINLAKRAFSKPYVFNTGISPMALSIKDLNADGCPDIVTLDKDGQTVTLLLNYLCWAE